MIGERGPKVMFSLKIVGRGPPAPLHHSSTPSSENLSLNSAFPYIMKKLEKLFL